MSPKQLYSRTTQMFFGKRQVAVVVVLLLLPALWAGCGDSDDGGDSTQAPTKSQFLSQAQSFCGKQAKQTEQEVEDFSTEHNLRYRKDAPTAVYEEAAEEVFAPSIERQIEGLKALGTPAGEEQALKKIYAAAEDGLQKGEADPALLISGQALTEVRSLAKDYGLDQCF